MRLIDADKIGLTDFEIILCEGSYKNVLETLLEKISNAPTAELPSAQPERKKWKWMRIGNTELANCKCGFITDRYSVYKYCPNCGCSMKGDGE